MTRYPAVVSRVTARLRAASPYLIPALVFLAVLLAMFWRIWTPIEGARKAFGWDAQWEYWGDLQFQLDAYRAGELPLWNPFDRAGYPFHADPQAGILYPVTWLLLAVGAILDGVPYWLMAVKTVLHFWIAALGLYAFLRRRGNPRAACYAGGFIFVFTYPFMHNSFSALNWSMAWAPWALLAIDAWSERPTTGRAAWVALALGMGELAGAMASFWYTLLVVVPYGAWALIHHARAATDRRAYIRTAASTAAVALGLFLAMVAAQFGATQALVPHTVRDTRTLDFIAAGAFGPDDLFGFLIPRFPGENCHVGYATIIWVGAVMAIRPTARTFVLSGVAVLGILCAFGNVAPYLPFSASVLPPFGFFRRAHRYLYVTVLALSILGAEGLTTLVRLQGRALRRRVGLAILVAGGIGLVIFGCGIVMKATTPHKDEGYRDAYALAFAFTVVATMVTWAVVAMRPRWRRAFLVVAAVFTPLSLAMAQYPKLELNLFDVPTTKRDADVRKLAGVPREARIYDREILRFRPGIRLRVRDLGGYEGDPLALERYARFLKAAKARPTLLAHANIRWLLEAGKTRTKPEVISKEGLTASKGGIYEVPHAVPVALWFDDAIGVRTPDEALEKLRAVAPGSTAIVEKPIDLGGGTLAPVPGRVLSFARNRLTVEVEAPADGLVVIHEAHYPGWKATVDGRATEVIPANAVFRGVPVSSGKHVIILEYPARSYVLLGAISILGFLAALVLAIRGWRRERRHSAQARTTTAP